jgi:hypothetical protein
MSVSISFYRQLKEQQGHAKRTTNNITLYKKWSSDAFRRLTILFIRLLFEKTLVDRKEECAY